MSTEAAPRKAGERKRGFPALYAHVYPIIVDVGREHGYAVALHGSLARDLDVLAVPWVEEPKDQRTFAEAVTRALEAVAGDDLMLLGPFTGKPHGRVVWTIALYGGAFVDLSVVGIGLPEGVQT